MWARTAFSFAICSVMPLVAIAQQQQRFSPPPTNNARPQPQQGTNTGSVRVGTQVQGAPNSQSGASQPLAGAQTGVPATQASFNQTGQGNRVPAQQVANTNPAGTNPDKGRPDSPARGTAPNNTPVQGGANIGGNPNAGGVPSPEQQLADFQRQALEMQRAKQAELAKMPFPPLNKEQQEYLDKVLDVWEKRTSTYNQYECKFNKLTYDPTQTADPDPVSKANGMLRYMAPDKGMYRVENIEFFVNRDAAGKAQYRVNEREKFGDYWICDGQFVFVLNRNDKKCLKVELPPTMRGQQIHMSPLPFLFGVKAKEITERYWVRPVAPPKGSKDVVLETFPKKMDDAANYSRVQVYLDPVEILPKALIVYLPNWRPDQPHLEIYEFADAKKNFNGLANKLLKPFTEEFIPNIPKDWEIEVEPYIADVPVTK